MTDTLPVAWTEVIPACLTTLEPGREVFVHRNLAQVLPLQPSLDLPTVSVMCVDARKPRFSRKCAAVLVPQGCEWKWAYISATGRLDLANARSCARLFIVYMNRGHDWSSCDVSALREWLVPVLDPLVPKGCAVSPFQWWSSQEEDEMGQRKLLAGTRDVLIM
jgi:hypothetical protein